MLFHRSEKLHIHDSAMNSFAASLHVASPFTTSVLNAFCTNPPSLLSCSLGLINVLSSLIPCICRICHMRFLSKNGVKSHSRLKASAAQLSSCFKAVITTDTNPALHSRHSFTHAVIDYERYHSTSSSLCFRAVITPDTYPASTAVV